eukprot:8819431-Lingulodinium_polyedra.AAC.1
MRGVETNGAVHAGGVATRPRRWKGCIHHQFRAQRRCNVGLRSDRQSQAWITRISAQPDVACGVAASQRSGGIQTSSRT